MARILVTSGASREPIDEVRFISNLSTGSTGARLAVALQALGQEVLLLHGEGAALPGHHCPHESFSSACDLEQRLQEKLGSDTWDAVIMCAAVADYRPEHSLRGKIASEADALTLRLVRNPKILPRIKSFAKRPPLVIGFKFTVGATQEERREAVAAQLASGTVDLVVHNDLHDIRASHVHPFNVHRSANDFELVRGAESLARSLSAQIDAHLLSR